MTVLSDRSTATVRHLLWYLLDDLIDDPAYYEETREQWADCKALAAELGIDLAELIREGRRYPEAVDRFSAVVGEDVTGIPSGR